MIFIYDNDTWYDLQNIPFSPYSKEQIKNAKKKLIRYKKDITPDRMVQELNFGFWTSFLNIRNNNTKIAPKLLKREFKNCPKSKKNFKFQRNAWTKIRELRNSVSHYNRIIHWQDLKSKHDLLIEAIGWINPDLQEMTQKLDTFADVYSKGIQPWSDKIHAHWPTSTRESEGVNNE